MFLSDFFSILNDVHEKFDYEATLFLKSKKLSKENLFI